jgi:sugar lactone lactonase YvrE
LCCARHLYPIPTLPFVQTEKKTKQGKAMKFMERNLPVLHFLFAILAFGLLTGCEMTTDVATQDTQESGGRPKAVMVSTFAGGKYGFVDGIGSAAEFNAPEGIASDAAGNLYVADTDNHRIRKITPAGEVSTIAGSEEGFADGVGGDARFYRPSGIAVDAAGHLYVADTLNHRIRKISPAGEVSTLAGGEYGFADGVGSDARFCRPSGIAIDAAGNLYVTDTLNRRIRKITPAGEVSTLAGGEHGFADGIGSDAKFHNPSGIAIDAVGNLYVADTANHRIRKITPAGEVSTLAGGKEGFADGVGRDAKFNYPEGIAIDAAGKLYVTDEHNYRIRKITPTREVSTLAGGRASFAGGTRRAAKFNDPRGITIDAAGNLYVTDGNAILKLVFVTGPPYTAMVSTIAGGKEGFADGIGSAAKFNWPSGITIDAAGNLYVADSRNYRIRKITPAGEVSTHADGIKNFADSNADDIRGYVVHYSPHGIAIDTAGNLYVTDHYESNRFTNDRIRKITPAGGASTLAEDCRGCGKLRRIARPFNYHIGKITPAGEVSGVGSAVKIHGHSGIATDAAGNLHVAPSGIAIDAAGNLYVAGNNAILKVTPAGEVSTFAGGEKGFADGIGRDARFHFHFHNLTGIAIDAAGNLYVADSGNNCIRKITPAGEVSTLAGSERGFADGIGGDAEFDLPSGIAIDAAGNLYVADTGNHRIRKIEIRRP